MSGEDKGGKGTRVDLIAKGKGPDEWRMVLVEQGPWREGEEAGLLRLQDRLYGCIDAALDGQLAAVFSESLGKKILIQLDCYNLSETVVRPFFERFSEGALSTPEYAKALKHNFYVREIGFIVTFDNIH